MSDFTLNKVSEKEYDVLKEGKPTYKITKAQKNWQCSCTGYKFKHDCKHVQAVNELEKANQPVDPTKQRHPRAEMEKFIPELTKICAPFDTWEIVGSWRRKSPTFKDVDVIALASPEAWNQVHQNLVDSGAWNEMIFGDTLMRGTYHGYYLDFNLCPNEEDWLWWLIYRTGSQAENVALRRRAIQMGYGISEKGIQDRYTFDFVDGVNSEEDFYHFFGYEYRTPEERTGEDFKELPNWNIEEHYSEGKKAIDYGDFDWHDYLVASMDKLKDRSTKYREAKYPARLCILVADEIARRTGTPIEEILSTVTPEEIQPQGFKKGQQTWTPEGKIYRSGSEPTEAVQRELFDSINPNIYNYPKDVTGEQPFRYFFTPDDFLYQLPNFTELEYIGPEITTTDPNDLDYHNATEEDYQPNLAMRNFIELYPNTREVPQEDYTLVINEDTDKVVGMYDENGTLHHSDDRLNIL